MLEDMDLELEEPVEAEAEEAGERQNRTFIILVAVMGGLLLIGIIAFCVWMFVVGRGVLTGGQAAIPPTATPEEAVIAAAETATAEAALAQAQVSPEPTATPTPSPTPVPPSPTPRPTIAAPQATPTPRVTATPGGTGSTPVPTYTPTATPSPPAQTGIGAYTALILAAGLLILLVISRRLRTATGGR
jgi:nitrate reductase NapE component